MLLIARKTYYGVKIYHFYTFIGIREFLERLSLDCIKNTFSNDTGTPQNNIPPLDGADEGEKVSTYRVLYFSSSVSPSTEVGIISEITLSSA